MEKELSTALSKPSRDMIGVAGDIKKNGRVSKVRRLWIRRKTTGFEYCEGLMTFTERLFEDFGGAGLAK